MWHQIKNDQDLRDRVEIISSMLSIQQFVTVDTHAFIPNIQKCVAINSLYDNDIVATLNRCLGVFCTKVVKNFDLML